MLHTLLGESIVSLGAVHKGVEEVLHVPEGDADGVVLGQNSISNHKTHKTEQNHRLFHRIKRYFECKYRLFRKKLVNLQRKRKILSKK